MTALDLLSGRKIPLRSASTFIRQPTVRDVSAITETTFFIGVNFLKFDRASLGPLPELEKESDFTVFSIIMEQGAKSVNVLAARLVLMLLFEEAEDIVAETGLVTIKGGDRDVFMNETVFNELREILNEIFAFTKGDNDDYVPANDAAAKIAEKLRAGRAKVAQMNGEGGADQEVSILARYVSILSIALQIDINTLLDYSVGQLFDNFKRFELYNAYDMNIRSRLAGAQDMEDPENWLKDLSE